LRVISVAAQDEDRELLYVIRTMEVMMGSGIGLEGAITSISRGGYGCISSDFQKVMVNTRKGKGLVEELRRVQKRAKSDAYKRLLNTMIENIISNTDIVKTLKNQGGREEEKRTEKVEKYIEELSGLPETLLSIGMISPIILAILAITPQMMAGAGDIMPLPDADAVGSIVNGGLFFTVVMMAMIGLKAHTKDPGL